MNLHYTYIIKIFLQIIIFPIRLTEISLQYLHVKYCIIHYLIKKCEMPINFNHKKGVLISSYKLDALFLGHLYKLLSVVC